MEHISHTGGESLAGVGAERWLVGVGEHLTQAPFVLWAGVCITMGLDSCKLRDGRGVLEHYKEKTILLEQLPLGHYHARRDDHLSSHLRCHLIFIFYSITINYILSCLKQCPDLSLNQTVKYRCN